MLRRCAICRVCLGRGIEVVVPHHPRRAAAPAGERVTQAVAVTVPRASRPSLVDAEASELVNLCRRLQRELPRSARQAAPPLVSLPSTVSATVTPDAGTGDGTTPAQPPPARSAAIAHYQARYAAVRLGLRPLLNELEARLGRIENELSTAGSRSLSSLTLDDVLAALRVLACACQIVGARGTVNATRSLFRLHWRAAGSAYELTGETSHLNLVRMLERRIWYIADTARNTEQLASLLLNLDRISLFWHRRNIHYGTVRVIARVWLHQVKLRRLDAIDAAMRVGSDNTTPSSALTRRSDVEAKHAVATLFVLNRTPLPNGRSSAIIALVRHLSEVVTDSLAGAPLPVAGHVAAALIECACRFSVTGATAQALVSSVTPAHLSSLTLPQCERLLWRLANWRDAPPARAATIRGLVARVCSIFPLNADCMLGAAARVRTKMDCSLVVSCIATFLSHDAHPDWLELITSLFAVAYATNALHCARSRDIAKLVLAINERSRSGLWTPVLDAGLRRAALERCHAWCCRTKRAAQLSGDGRRGRAERAGDADCLLTFALDCARSLPRATAASDAGEYEARRDAEPRVASSSEANVSTSALAESQVAVQSAEAVAVSRLRGTCRRVCFWALAAEDHAALSPHATSVLLQLVAEGGCFQKLAPAKQDALFHHFANATSGMSPRDYAAACRAIFAWYPRVDAVTLSRVTSMLLPGTFVDRLTPRDVVALAEGWISLAAQSERDGSRAPRPDAFCVEAVSRRMLSSAPTVVLADLPRTVRALRGIGCMTPKMFTQLARALLTSASATGADGRCGPTVGALCARGGFRRHGTTRCHGI